MESTKRTSKSHSCKGVHCSSADFLRHVTYRYTLNNITRTNIPLFYFISFEYNSVRADLRSVTATNVVLRRLVRVIIQEKVRMKGLDFVFLFIIDRCSLMRPSKQTNHAVVSYPPLISAHDTLQWRVQKTLAAVCIN